MANHVTNRMTLIGNSSIKKLTKEITRRFVVDMKEHTRDHTDSDVGRVLYGLTGTDAELGAETTGADWVRFDYLGEDALVIQFVSAWVPVHGLQDFILECVSKLDPNVIVINEYLDEAALFIGCRIVLLDNDNVIEFVREEDTSDLSVVSEKDFDDDSESITWDDLYDQRHEMKLELLREIINEYAKYNRKSLYQAFN